jgi:hypothetical protein
MDIIITVMSNLVYLRHNTEPVLLNNLVTGDGQVLEALVFNTGSIWYDEQGIIRQFSVHYNQNKYGNYFLMPLQSDTLSFTRTIAGDLAEFGIKVVASSIFSGSTLIVDLARFLFEKYGNVALTDLMEGLPGRSMAYIAIDNKEVVLQGVLNIRQAVSIRLLQFFIKNDTQYVVVYEISRDLSTWKSGTLASYSLETLYFANRQTSGYARLYTNNRPGHTYAIKATETYSIYFDPTLQLWSLSILPK